MQKTLELFKRTLNNILEQLRESPASDYILMEMLYETTARRFTINAQNATNDKLRGFNTTEAFMDKNRMVKKEAQVISY